MKERDPEQLNTPDASEEYLLEDIIRDIIVPAGTVDRFTVPGGANEKIGMLIRGRPGSSAAFSADKEKK